ncbi:MAG TPA: hypothetical protein VHW95_00215 [Steroidobacteraceae bacterium]|nr:hypothetical protein [Steroidobacteraceae bacterium]
MVVKVAMDGAKYLYKAAVLDTQLTNGSSGRRRLGRTFMDSDLLEYMQAHDQHAPDLPQWTSPEPREAISWFAGVRAPWWIAGGWAIDLFLRKQTRIHLDLDVGVLRRDLTEILSMLKSWEIFEAKDGALSPLADGILPRSEVNSLWCRRSSDGPWMLELMLDDAEGENWVYRRDREVRQRLRDALCPDASGILHLAPEIQLLYKSKSVRPKDEADFRLTLPHLGAEARQWLLKSLLQRSPLHPWLAEISPSDSVQP